MAKYHSLQSFATAPAVGDAVKLVSAVGNVGEVKGVDAGTEAFPADVVYGNEKDAEGRVRMQTHQPLQNAIRFTLRSIGSPEADSHQQVLAVIAYGGIGRMTIGE